MGAVSDLVFFCSVNMPEDDTAASGGAIDLDARLPFIQLPVDDDIEVVSSSAADTTQQIGIEVRQPDGTVVAQTVTLSGTTPVPLTTLGTISRVLECVLFTDAAGTVTVRRGGNAGNIGTIPPGERAFRAFLREATASALQTENFYHKGFIKNTHATDTFTGPVVSLNSDPTNRVTFALATATNDSGSVANRKTAPGGLTFDTAAKAVPGGDLIAGEAIGVWIKVALPAGDSTHNIPLELAVAGTW